MVMVALTSLAGAQSGGRCLYVSPTGNDANSGAKNSQVYSLSKVISLLAPGDTAYMRGGTYSYTAAIEIAGKKGSANGRFYILAYPGEKPILNYSAWKPATEAERGSARGFKIDSTSSYWYFKGLEVCYAPDNGAKVEGEHTTFD